eukprot:CAMPEP_0118938604 /NCGR_PEP_ID=MMETSP1169-20130426/26486_1 /TAXON_ID=36882 /ORGANISM="Pyramimonas obovata, Strain CCMP722" /LENGTH=262 /DNA_ID=CAMNT_0006882585 /DNA_START=127 /DNA_END=912 /DNA_ORIENTATION=+
MSLNVNCQSLGDLKRTPRAPKGREDTHWLQHGDTVVLFTMDRVPFVVSSLGGEASDDFQLKPDEAAPFRDECYFFNTQVLKNPHSQLQVLKDGRWFGFQSKAADCKTLQVHKTLPTLRLTNHKFELWERWNLMQWGAMIQQPGGGLCQKVSVVFRSQRKPHVDLHVYLVRLPRASELTQAWAALVLDQAAVKFDIEAPSDFAMKEVAKAKEDAREMVDEAMLAVMSAAWRHRATKRAMAAWSRRTSQLVTKKFSLWAANTHW